jgi:class 3 adenylate cyclase
MQRALEAFNARRGTGASGDGRADATTAVSPGAAPLVMRIGLNCGKVVRGDIGSRYVRRDYTCIGDVVNRAQRHEAKCPLGGVLLSSELYTRIRDVVIVERMDGITLKGIDTPVSAYVLKGFSTDP